MNKTATIRAFLLKAKSYKLKASRGFTLVELLISVVMLGIITGFILAAYNRVNNQLTLSTLTYEVALSFREAQSYGVSVRGTSATDFTAGYGLHFDSGSSNTYAMFADLGDINIGGQFNGAFGSAYNADGCINTTECMQVFKIGRGNTIAKFCGVLPGDGGKDAADGNKKEDCNANSLPAGNQTEITYLDVTFLRPNPDAIIKTSQFQQYKSARIYLRSQSGQQRIVEVMNTGQISIK